MILASIIIINYNTSNLTIDAVKSVIQNNTNKYNLEIIIVDNASEKKDLSNLEQQLQNISFTVKLIKSRINLGLHYQSDNDFAIEVAEKILKHKEFCKKYNI